MTMHGMTRRRTEEEEKEPVEGAQSRRTGRTARAPADRPAPLSDAPPRTGRTARLHTRTRSRPHRMHLGQPRGRLVSRVVRPGDAGHTRGAAAG